MALKVCVIITLIGLVSRIGTVDETGCFPGRLRLLDVGSV